MEIAPELAGRLRDDVRSGRVTAERKRGAAGRPYIVRTETLATSDVSEYRELAEVAEKMPAPVTVRRRNRMAEARSQAGMMEASSLPWAPLFQILEAQHLMLKDVVGVVSQEMKSRYDRQDRQQLQIQELSFKLGQAHQEVARLERMMAERGLRGGRMEEA